MPGFGSRAFQGVLGAVARDAVNLAGKQLDLLKAETRENARRLSQVVILAVIGAAATIVSIVFAGLALFEWLVVVMQTRAWAAFTVAGLLAMLALITLTIACRRLAGTTFIPRRTLASLRRDGEVLFKGTDDE